MKISDLIAALDARARVSEDTLDTVKAGNPDAPLTRVAVTMMATVDVIKAAAEWGAELLIMHESLYFDHRDRLGLTPLAKLKEQLVADTGLTVYRYHDHMHHLFPDEITIGELEGLGLRGKLEKTEYFASYRLTLDEPTTAREIARRAREELGVKHVRICGAVDRELTHVAACFGMPAGTFELLCEDETELLIIGETVEWKVCEYARDAAAMGLNKSMIVMGHIGSEREGMKRLTKTLAAEHPDLEFRYFECGEVYL